jgi:hypothetical protein
MRPKRLRADEAVGAPRLCTDATNWSNAMKATVLGFVALAALASATLCGRSLAAEWEPVTETESAVYLIDRTSLGPAQAVQSAWVLVTGGHGRGLEHYGSRTQLMVFDCDRRAVALKQYALHSRPAGRAWCFAPRPTTTTSWNSPSRGPVQSAISFWARYAIAEQGARMRRCWAWHGADFIRRTVGRTAAGARHGADLAQLVCTSQCDLPRGESKLT